MQTAHKHAKLIKVWADGSTIQYLCGNQWFECHPNGPTWDIRTEYRVKPVPNPDYSKFIGLYAHENTEFNSHAINGVYSSSKYNVPEEKLTEFNRYLLCNKLELVFDGETKELKEVKIHGKE